VRGESYQRKHKKDSHDPGNTYTVRLAACQEKETAQAKPAAPRQRTHFSANGLLRFAISPDSKQVVLARDSSTSDTVLITHLP